MKRARNNAIGVAKARQNPSNFAAPKLIRNEFGGSVGEPIFIPKIYNGKNRSFFFAYERFSLRQSSDQLVRVPTVAMRNGDFSGLINGAGIQQIIHDPNTTQAGNLQRTPFPNNQIPIIRISPLAKTMYAATPLPHTNDNPLVNSNITDVNPITQTVPNITTRLDHVFNQNNRMYFRFTDIDQKQQALRNYPSPSPANIAGGGLPAGALSVCRVYEEDIATGYYIPLSSCQLSLRYLLLGARLSLNETSNKIVYGSRLRKFAKVSTLAITKNAFDIVKVVGLALPNVALRTKYDGSPVLKVCGVFMAGIAMHPSAEPETLVVRCGLEERRNFIADVPETFYLTNYYQKYPLVLVRLSRVDPDALRDLLSVSWKMAIAKVPKRAGQPIHRYLPNRRSV